LLITSRVEFNSRQPANLKQGGLECGFGNKIGSGENYTLHSKMKKREIV